MIFVWLLEKHFDSIYKDLAWWMPVVVKAENEKEAWEKLYSLDSCLWWILQGERHYENGKSNSKQLKYELDLHEDFKTKEAIEPKVWNQEGLIKPLANY